MRHFIYGVIVEVLVIGAFFVGTAVEYYTDPRRAEMDNYEKYFSQLPPFEWYSGCAVPSTSSVEFPNGLKVTVDYTNTEQYKNQVISTPEHFGTVR